MVRLSEVICVRHSILPYHDYGQVAICSSPCTPRREGTTWALLYWDGMCTMGGDSDTTSIINNRPAHIRGGCSGHVIGVLCSLERGLPPAKRPLPLHPRREGLRLREA